MRKQSERIFSNRFGDRVEIVYSKKPLEGEERRLNRQRMISAVRAVMAAALKREPTQEEFLGLVPVVARRKRAAA